MTASAVSASMDVQAVPPGAVSGRHRSGWNQTSQPDVSEAALPHILQISEEERMLSGADYLRAVARAEAYMDRALRALTWVSFTVSSSVRWPGWLVIQRVTSRTVGGGGGSTGAMSAARSGCR